MLTTMMDGAAIAQAIGPLKHVITSDEAGERDNPKRYLLVTPLDSNTPVLVQALREVNEGHLE